MHQHSIPTLQSVLLHDLCRVLVPLPSEQMSSNGFKLVHGLETPRVESVTLQRLGIDLSWLLEDDHGVSVVGRSILYVRRKLLRDGV